MKLSVRFNDIFDVEKMKANNYRYIKPQFSDTCGIKVERANAVCIDGFPDTMANALFYGIFPKQDDVKNDKHP